MRVAVLTPLPPTKSGVAHYASMLLPALGQHVDVRAFASLDGYRRADFDHVVYQLGNNPHHELMYLEAMREPGVVVLHDLVLHHLIVELTLARGDVEGYVRALEASHGAAGAAWARGRAAGLHSEMGNFLLPASVELANRSRAVIVHNHYAADRLRSFGVTTSIVVVPHPYVHETPRAAPIVFPPESRVIGFFGFLTSAKRAEVVLEAFRIARERDPRLVLLIVGEPAPNLEVPRGEGIVSTGYVADEDFSAYYSVADRLVNLRYPSAGETSGTLIRALDAGKPVAVSDYAQFAELPDDVVFKVPFGAEKERLVEFFTSELPDPAAAQRAWLDANASMERTVAGYLQALAVDTRANVTRVDGALPLFAKIERTATGIRNAGATTLHTRTYGIPEFRLIVDGKWLALPKDLAPGEAIDVDGERFEHAIQDIPMLEPERVR
jgi:glycosyltransferase involved in cell wall biosynthesis